jgi:hypothetical protein
VTWDLATGPLLVRHYPDLAGSKDVYGISNEARNNLETTQTRWNLGVVERSRRGVVTGNSAWKCRENTWHFFAVAASIANGLQIH